MSVVLKQNSADAATAGYAAAGDAAAAARETFDDNVTAKRMIDLAGMLAATTVQAKRASQDAITIDGLVVANLQVAVAAYASASEKLKGAHDVSLDECPTFGALGVAYEQRVGALKAALETWHNSSVEELREWVGVTNTLSELTDEEDIMDRRKSNKQTMAKQYQAGKEMVEEGEPQMRLKLWAKKASTDAVELDQKVLRQFEQALTAYELAATRLLASAEFAAAGERPAFFTLASECNTRHAAIKEVLNRLSPTPKIASCSHEEKIGLYYLRCEAKTKGQ